MCKRRSRDSSADQLRDQGLLIVCRFNLECGSRYILETKALPSRLPFLLLSPPTLPRPFSLSPVLPFSSFLFFSVPFLLASRTLSISVQQQRLERLLNKMPPYVSLVCYCTFLFPEFLLFLSSFVMVVTYTYDCGGRLSCCCGDWCRGCLLVVCS